MSQRSKLWLALRFPDLCINVLSPEKDPNGWVVSEKQRVFIASHTALEKGVRIDMDVTTAQLLCDQEALERDRAKEQAQYSVLMNLMYQVTPYIEMYNSRHEYGLLLEISRCLTLFRGVKNLLNRVNELLKTVNVSYAHGFAHSAKAAWFLSYQDLAVDEFFIDKVGEDGHMKNVHPSAQIFIKYLKSVPLTLFREYPQDIEQLSKSGFYVFGDVFHQLEKTHVDSFRKRFSPEFVQDIKDIFGVENELQSDIFSHKPIQVFKPVCTFKQDFQFDFPVLDIALIEPALDVLLKNLEAYLIAKQVETKRIYWQLRNIYGDTSSMDVVCDYPQVSMHLFLKLSMIKLESIELPFEVDQLELACTEFNAVVDRDQTLSLDGKQGSDANNEALSLVLAKLAARLGEQAISKVVFEQEIVPEKCGVLKPALPLSRDIRDTMAVEFDPVTLKALRPSWLLERPLILSSKNGKLFWHGEITLISNVERIETQWWGPEVKRDYFLAKRNDNLYLWVYQDLVSRCWHIHGFFS